MRSEHLLRRQVASEIKRRRYIVYTILLLSLLYVSVNLVISDTGLLKYMEIKKTEASLERDLDRVVADNERLKEDILTHKDTDFYVEKHAREEFGLARSDEYIFIFDKSKDPGSPAP